MKTYSNIFSQIYSFENLLHAAQKARLGKRYKDYVGRFYANLEYELIALQNELQQKRYQPGEYRTFTIYKPKQRMISAAPFRDRVLHHALCNVIEPLFERKFIFDSYANRKGKGAHKAVLRYQHFCRKNKFALKCDLQKYFPSIDHDILKQQIRRTIRCHDTLWLIDRIIDGSNEQEPVLHYFAGDEMFTPLTRRHGLPIGNLTSQFFANVYLNPFDHFMKEHLRIRYYLRYVDDFIILGQDKHWLQEVKYEIDAYLARLRMLLHPNKSQVRRTAQGVTFLGFRVFPEFRLLPRKNINHARQRLRQLQHKYNLGEIDLQDVRRAVHGWIGHACIADSYRLQRKIFAEHPFSRAYQRV